MVRNCKYCGEDHPVRQCPAYGVQCEKCEKLNHFTKVCLSVSDNTPRRSYTPRRRSQPDSQQLHEIDYDDDQQLEDIMEHYVIEAVDIPGSQSEIHITAIASGNRFDLKIDSGAKCNVVSMNTLQSMRIPFTINTSERITLISYSNTEMRTLGTCELQCVIANQNAILKFHVIDKPVKSIIGLPDALRLQLLHLHPRVHIKTKETQSSIWDKCRHRKSTPSNTYKTQPLRGRKTATTHYSSHYRPREIATSRTRRIAVIA